MVRRLCCMLALLGGLWGIVATTTGCTLLLDFTECVTDSDCSEGSVCRSDGLCEKPDEGEACEIPPCGPPTSLTGDVCDRYEGPTDGDVFPVGVILQVSDPSGGAGAGFGRPMLNAILLAQNDINGIAGVGGRRIGLVICDTQGRDQRALDGAQHLRNVGVQAVIGMNSSQVMTVAPQVTIPGGMLLVSPSATATTITNLEDNGLVWRTAPSDAIQGEALAQLINYAMSDVIGPQATEPIKVALLVRSNDRYANGLRESVARNLSIDILSGGSDRFTTLDYPNAGAGQPADYSGVVSSIAAEAVEPDVVIILGSAEAWELAASLDGLIKTKRPLYFVGDAVKNADAAGRAPASLEGRIWGTSPQNIGEWEYAPYVAFRVKYQSAYNVQNPDEFQFIANAFDAMYLVALAASQGFVGSKLAMGMTLFSSGDSFEPTPDQAQQALRLLRQGTSIKVRGASGPLNFDAQGDPAARPIALWCFEDGRVPEKGVIFNDNVFSPLRCGPPS